MVAFATQDYRSWSAACDRLPQPRMLSWRAARAGVFGQRAPRLTFAQKKLALDVIHEQFEAGANRREAIAKLIRSFEDAHARQIARIDEGVGVSVLLIIGLVSLAANLYRLYLEWREQQELNGWVAAHNHLGTPRESKEVP